MNESFAEAIKDRTWDLHARAEQDSVPRQLLSGRLPRETYIAMLEQYLAAFATLDEALVAARRDAPELDAIILDEQLSSRYLREDLGFLGGNRDAEPSPAAADLIEAIRSADTPWTLLGMHYVREGSTNGNSFIARAIRGAYGLHGAEGTRYLDPYGPAQRQKWAAFKLGLDTLGLTHDQRERAIEGARTMFAAIIDIHKDLEPALTVQTPDAGSPTHA